MPDAAAVASLPPIPPDCLEFVLHVWDYLDDRLPPARARVLREHIARCGNCQAYQAFQRSFLAALARQRTHAPAPAVLRARVQHLLREQGLSPG